MNEERRQILEMLAQDKVTVEEAERLLRAVQGSGNGGTGLAARAADSPQTRVRPRYLRVLVIHGDAEQVNVRVPIGVLRAGVKLSAVLPESVRQQVEGHGQGGLPFDLSKLSGENLDEFIAALSDEGIEVKAGDENDNVHIRVFCE